MEFVAFWQEGRDLGSVSVVLDPFAKSFKNACQNTDIMVPDLGSFCRRMIQIYTGMVSKNTDFEPNFEV